jgi:hypothetical protein
MVIIAWFNNRNIRQFFVNFTSSKFRENTSRILEIEMWVQSDITSFICIHSMQFIKITHNQKQLIS